MRLEVVFHIPATIEFVCSGKVSAFHLPKNDRSVNKSHVREVEVDACSEEFFGKHRYVELV